MPKYESLSMIPDVVNLNNRIYPRTELERAVKNFQARIDKGEQILGQYYDFNGVFPDDQHDLNLSMVCCETTSVRIDDDGVKAVIKTRGPYRNNIDVAVSENKGFAVGPFMLASVEETDEGTVVKNIEIKRMDIYPNESYAWDVGPMKRIK